jgi:two-component system, OmpR family, phosphate regulon response regulator PhoB
MIAKTAYKTVLVIEDELDMRLFLKVLLETNGYAPMFSGNGRDGIEKAKAHAPDLIVMDVMMPDQGGARTYRDLRSDPDLKRIPVIMLSAVARDTFFHYLKMLDAGSAQIIAAPEAYVEKPPDPRYLLKCIDQFI